MTRRDSLQGQRRSFACMLMPPWHPRTTPKAEPCVGSRVVAFRCDFFPWSRVKIYLSLLLPWSYILRGLRPIFGQPMGKVVMNVERVYEAKMNIVEGMIR